MEISLCKFITPKNPNPKFTPSFSFYSFPKRLLLTISKKQRSSSSSNLTTKIKKPSFLEALIFKPLDDYICNFIDIHLPQFINPTQVLSGNFFPVDELPPTPCRVIAGSLPPCLDGGTYIQNGANPQFIPRGPYHMVDGDGMLHAITISGGAAVFCSRFVWTHKFTIERSLGYPIFPNPVALFSYRATWSLFLSVARMLTGNLLINPLINGLGTANTSLSLIAGRLYAMVEADLPYALNLASNGDITTVGRHDFHSNQLGFINMTAHPKIDRETHEAFAFRFSWFSPYLTFFRIDSMGRKQKDVPIYSVNEATFIHDFAVTKSFAVFPDVPIVIRPLDAMRGAPVIKVDLGKTPRLGVIPRYAADESGMKWIEAPGLNILHVIHAWEEDDDGGRIVIVATNAGSIEYILERTDLIKLSMEKITIDVGTETIIDRCPISPANLDFGVINPDYSSNKTRYVYASTIETMPKMSGVVKLDLSLCPGNCTVASRAYGPGCYGSQPMFVSIRDPENPELAAEEDDGYLVAYVHDEKNDEESKFIVMDAKSPVLEIVAAVKQAAR